MFLWQGNNNNNKIIGLLWIILIILIVIITIVLLICVAASIVKRKRKNDYKQLPRNTHHFDTNAFNNVSSITTEREVFLSPEERKGQEAENYVARKLQIISLSFPYSFLINNIFIPSGKDKDGNIRTVEIDHILFTPYGLFVIETKSRAGTIYGNEDDDKWSAVLGYSNIKEHFFNNPIKQNKVHINALKRLLRKDDLVVFSYVVFEEGDISNIDSDIVMTINNLEENINSDIEKEVYSEQYLTTLYNRINYYKEHPPQTKEEHIRDIHKDHHKMS